MGCVSDILLILLFTLFLTEYFALLYLDLLYTRISINCAAYALVSALIGRSTLDLYISLPLPVAFQVLENPDAFHHRSQRLFNFPDHGLIKMQVSDPSLKPPRNLNLRHPLWLW